MAKLKYVYELRLRKSLPTPRLKRVKRRYHIHLSTYTLMVFHGGFEMASNENT